MIFAMKYMSTFIVVGESFGLLESGGHFPRYYLWKNSLVLLSFDFHREKEEDIRFSLFLKSAAPERQCSTITIIILNRIITEAQTILCCSSMQEAGERTLKLNFNLIGFKNQSSSEFLIISLLSIN